MVFHGDSAYGGPRERARRIEALRERLRESDGRDALAREWLEILTGVVAVHTHRDWNPVLFATGSPALCRRPTAYQCDCGRWLRVRRGRFGPTVRCRRCGTRRTLNTPEGRRWASSREMAGQVRRCGAELTVAVDPSGIPYRTCTRCGAPAARAVTLDDVLGSRAGDRAPDAATAVAAVR